MDNWDTIGTIGDALNPSTNQHIGGALEVVPDQIDRDTRDRCPPRVGPVMCSRSPLERDQAVEPARWPMCRLVDGFNASPAVSSFMAWWITVYCSRDCSALQSTDLASGIRAGDPDALAGVDYFTLAEDYDVPETVVAPALEHLRVTGDFEIHYESDPDARPVVVHVWTQPGRVREEVEEAREVRSAPTSAAPFLDGCRAVVGIELGVSMAQTMGVVLAYEVARYIAQKYDGVIVDDEDRWEVVREGALVPLQG